MYMYICIDSDMSYPDSEKDQMTALDTLAAYHVQQARQEKNREKRKDFFAQVIMICTCTWYFQILHDILLNTSPSLVQYMYM